MLFTYIYAFLASAYLIAHHNAHFYTPSPQQTIHQQESARLAQQSAAFRHACLLNQQYFLPIQLVECRCTIIDFSHGTLQQTPLLPTGFVDNFDHQSVSELLFGQNSIKDYHHHFHQTLAEHAAYNAEKRNQYARAQMRRWAHYKNSNFHAFIKELPVYQDYILEIDAQITHDPEFGDRLKQTHEYAHEYIQHEAAAIRQAHHTQEQKAQQKVYHQQQARIAQTVFAHQQNQTAVIWHQSNQKRFAAYQATQLSDEAHTQYYRLSPTAQKALHTHNIQTKPYQKFHGNALQHELMQEAIAGLEHAARIKLPTPLSLLDSMLHKKAFEAYDDARFATEIGDCLGSSKLIDLGNALVDYFRAITQGTAAGLIDGASSAIVGTYHLVRHPLDSAHALTALAIKMGQLLTDYIPPTVPDMCNADEWDAYILECERVSRNWQHTADKIKQYWRSTSSPEMAKQAAYAITSTATNLFVVGKCMSILGSAAQCAKAELLSPLKQAAASLTEMRAVPGYILIEQTSNAIPLYRAAKQLEISQEMLERIIANPEWQDFTTLTATLEQEYKIIQELADKVQSLKPTLSAEKPLSFNKRIKLAKEYTKLLDVAAREYETIRNTNADIAKISQHTGIDKKIIMRIKEHLFLNEHNLGNGRIAKYDPCPDMLDVWKRLSSGEFCSTDLELLQHEYYESILMNMGKLEWRKAHDLTMRLFPWLP